VAGGDRSPSNSLADDGENRFRALIENSSDTIVLIDAGGRIVWASPSIESEIDYSLEDEFLGHAAFEFIHDDDREDVMKEFVSLQGRAGARIAVEFRARRKDGSWRWVEATAKNLLHHPDVQAIVCNYHDITDRREAEAELRRSESSFRAIIEYSTDILAVLAPGGEVRYLSPAVYRVLGYSPEALPSDFTLYSVIHPEDIEAVRASIGSAVAAPGIPLSTRLRVLHSSGEWRHLEATGRALIDEAGKPYGVINARDVTERVEAEEALRRSEERSRAVLEHSSDIIAVIDSRAFITYANPAAERLFGRAEADFHDVMLLDLIHSEDVATVANAVARGLQHPGVPQAVRVRVQDRNGEWRHLEGVGQLALNDSGTPYGVLNCRDVTERVRTEEALRGSQARTAAVVETALDAIVSIDHRGVITEFNAAAERVLGYRREEAIGRPMVELIVPPSLRRKHLAGIRRYLKTGERRMIGKRIELIAMRADGSEFPAEVAITQIPSVEPPAFTGYVRDITDRKRYTADLEQRVASRTVELQETIQELKDFASTISHDLRAPLRTIRGYGKAVLDDYADELHPAGKRFAERVVESTQQMDGMITGILEYSSLARGDIPLTTVRLAAVVAKTLAILEDEITAQGAVVTVRQPLRNVIGHEQTLVQVLVNLVGNAVKFVPEGVQPQVWILTEARRGYVRLSVDDNGVGVEPRHAERIFAVFERLHSSDRYPGSGMGLAIVRKSLERLGGRTGVEARAGGGSRFWIELPSSTTPGSRTRKAAR